MTDAAEHVLSVRASTSVFHPFTWACSCGRGGSAESEGDAQRKFNRHLSTMRGASGGRPRKAAK